MQTQINSTINQEEALLATAHTYFKEQVASQAALIDRDKEALKQALKGMGDRQLLALKVPQQWGGTEVCEITFRRFQIMVARYSGTLAFLQTQHQTAGTQLARSPNEDLKKAYLPSMAPGKVLVGVGFSQLRRQGDPLMKAIPTKGGYQLMGEVPWITGWEIFDDFIIGAMLPTGEAVYGMVPFREEDRLSFSQPMELAVMGTTNTVSATLDNWFLSSDRLISLESPGAIQRQDQKNALHHGFFSLGCAQGGLDIIQEVYQHKKLPFLQHTFNCLNEELTRCTQEMFEALSDDNYPWEKRLSLRGWAINLAGRCTHGAIIASSGAANFLSHPAQRVYREALVFSVAGQTTSVMEMSLTQLLSPES